MTIKELLIQEIDDASDPLLVEVLDFLQFLKTKQAEDKTDILEAREALASVAAEGTVPWEALKAEVGL
ncbi:DUF2281 domain-containing protein [filamentous cyanobacterium CCP3]|nr:DUF2281 domain-containing protein [filamentous cyanobacterium CCP3]